ncbi:MAG TPA: carboxypeptidase regulatory-like domain-containing protein [Longimicrobiales bacterium]|nr:carboxypeptidase regulatory-like domain-containing protein [Longimicrobiales bacterium]
MRLVLAVALLAALAPPRPALAQERPAAARDSAARGAVAGTVRGRFDGSLRPLAYALVELDVDGVRRTAVADADGRYRLAELRPGDARLAVSHAGYAPLSVVVSVPEGNVLTLDLELAGTPVALPAIEVLADWTASAGGGRGPDEERARPISEIDMQALDLGPGVGQAGLLDVVGALPGHDPADATDVLFMRGSTTDLKLVLLDGVPVYTPFHVAGLMRSFEPDVLGSADLHVGGAPARFDGGLTHILDLRTRTPRSDRLRFSGSLDLIAASAAVEAPLGGRAGLLLSGRSLHDLGSAPLGGRRPYGYQDLLLTTVVEPARGHELRATGFWNAESVVLDANDAPDDASWANRAASLAYRTQVAGARLDVTAGLSGYRAALPLQPSRPPGQPLPAPLLTSAATDRARLVGEVTWGSAGEPVRVGASVERLEAEVSAEELGGGPRAVSRGSTSVLGAFVDVTRLITDGVTLRGGARVDHFGDSGAHVAPRAALSFELSREALLTLAAGRYHQPTRTPHVEVERTLAEVSSQGVPPAELLPVATADHVVLTLDQRMGERVRLGLEGFWKSFSDLPTAPDETVRSSGIDVRVLTAGSAGAAWLGYGLSWFWSTVDLSGRTSEFMGRHLLSMGVSGSLGGPLRGEARLSYGAGLPYTSIPFGSQSTTVDAAHTQSGTVIQQTELASAEPAPLVGGLDEEFLRLDLELHMLLEPTVGGRAWRVRPYIRLLNALDRRDALFYTFQPWRSDVVRPLAERPVLPLVGVAISF